MSAAARQLLLSLNLPMLLNDQLDVSSAPMPGQSDRLIDRLPAAFSRALLLLLFFAVVVALQVASGAYHSEFGGYPDEPAHYVTSLMLREYIIGPTPAAPMQFAQAYYAHYPKVALGHWPPLFYVIQALWMLLFSPARASILLELAATTALLAYVVYWEARRWFGSNAALVAGLLTVCLPLIQAYTDEEMSETLLVLTCFLSAIYFARYLDSEHWRDSLWFGVFFSAAVLTKGSGWLLVLLPPVALLLTRKLRLLLRRSFWISVLIIAPLCIPWQLMTMQIAERGWTGGTGPSVGYTLTALGQFAILIARILGPALSVLLIVGILASLLRKRIASGPAAMVALVLAVWVFHSLVPAGIEDRKMIIAIPAMILLVFAGGFWIAQRLPLGRLNPWRPSLVALVAAFLFLLQTFAIPHETRYGYREAAKFLTSDPRFRGASILASSGTVGEGLLVSEIAMREPRPSDTIVRATKALAEVDWAGFHYRSLYSTPAEIIGYLRQQHIDLVVLDTFKSTNDFPHDRLLRQTVEQSGRFQPIATFRPEGSSNSEEVQLYRFLPR